MVYKNNRTKKHGFTLVEMLIIAPIVIFVIGVFISAIISMTGNVLTSRGANALAYSINDALTRIDQDVKASGGFLSISFVPIAGQGFDNGNGTAAFENTSVANGNMLVLNSYATDQNPLTTTRNVINMTGIPFGCSSPYVSQNKKLMTNIVYYVKNINSVNTLWRRVLMPITNYNDVPATVCALPWQKPTCVAGNGNTNCKANDQELVDGITAFTPTYWTGASPPVEITTAEDPAQLANARQIALQGAASVNVVISASTTLSGRTVTRTGSIRSMGIQSPTMLTQPSNQIVAAGASASFLSAANGTNMSIKWEQSTDKGVTWTAVSGTNQTLTFTASAGQDGNLYHAIYTNSYGQVISSPALLTVNASGWTGFAASSLYVNSYSDYAGGYNLGGFMKTTSGIVVLRGMIKRTGTPVASETIATLPVGFRPTAPLLFGTSTNPNTAGCVYIEVTGEIQWCSGSATWESLDNIHFIADTGRYNSTPVTAFYNGWGNYGQGWGNASYVVDPYGRVNLQGLLGLGTRGDGVRVFDLPNNLLPSGYMHIPQQGCGFSGMGLTPNWPGSSAINDKGLGTCYLPVNLLYYPANPTPTPTWTSLTLQNSWVIYGGSYSTPQYTKAADGLVSVKGLIMSGTMTAGLVIAQLPSGFRPSAQLLFQTYATGASGRVDIDTSGNIIYNSGANGWYSLDGITFYADGS